MSKQAVESSWRWSDAGVTAVLYYVPMTGLAARGWAIDGGHLVASVMIGLLVAAVMSAPMEGFDLRVGRVASARRVFHAVWTAAAGAAACSLAGIGQHSLISTSVSLAVIWLALSVSVAQRPLVTGARTAAAEAPAWLPTTFESSATPIGKRCFDIVVSAAALVLISPLLVVVALAIRAHDGGPVLFRQERIGRGGVPFKMLKFRSMVLDAEARRAELESQSDRSGPLFKMTNDPRITPIGRWIRELSIDELPQLFNILRGEMSLVGPRPALPDEAVQFDSVLQRRTIVTPGLTGLWQAEARSDANFERFRELDLRYVATTSPSLDLWIILATAAEVLSAVVSIPLRAIGIDGRRVDGIVSATRPNASDSANRPTAA